jgi:hypothetical protein
VQDACNLLQEKVDSVESKDDLAFAKLQVAGACGPKW